MLPADTSPTPVDYDGDGTTDPFHGSVTLPWDGGQTLPVGAHVRLTAPFSADFRATLVDGFVAPCGPVETPVTIDVVPFSSQNRVYPTFGRSLVPVSILSTPTFSADAVQPGSIRFGRTGSEAAALITVRFDLNGDGRRDLVAIFRQSRTGIVCGDTRASLTGSLSPDGARFRGEDAISTRC